MDVRITDNLADPPGAPGHATEALRRLPCFLCYELDWQTLEQCPPGGLPTGPVTFGSFNTILKHSPSVLRCWARILRAVDGSRLLLKTFAQLRPPTPGRRTSAASPSTAST